MDFELKKIFDYFDARFDLNKLFSVGIYHRFRNVERIYLDEMQSSFDKIEYLKRNIISKIENDELYACMVTYTEVAQENFPGNSIIELNRCGIDTEREVVFKCLFDEEEEWYSNLLFFKLNYVEIEKFISGVLFRTESKRRSFSSEFFIVNYTTKKVINVYDDRGVDILEIGNVTPLE
ncbi:MAG: hypothetical protein EP338_09005 [Bacteroidetes bacterium]|nr:MAG: hypothetical protein EP338_09005 [Bacteroidota bacterium]